MSPLCIIGLVLFAIALVVVVIISPSTDNRPNGTGYAGNYSVPPEHGEVPPEDYYTQPDEPAEPKICPVCGAKTLYETVGPYTEQFGQGTTTIEGVTFQNCSSCGFAADDHG